MFLPANLVVLDCMMK